MIHIDIKDSSKYCVLGRKSMDLRTYLFQKRISITKFSKTLGCSRIHLSEIVNGRRIPSMMLAKHIELLTNGEVKAKELLKEKDE